MRSVLILHGWGSCAKNWDKVKELLEKDGLRVLVPDLPGFGETPAPLTAWSVNDYVQWVKDFSGKNNLDQFFLLGHSFGGRIAIKFAVKYPEKLKGLILAAAAGITRRRSLKNFLFLSLAEIGNIIFSLPFVNKLKYLFQRTIYKIAGSRDYLLAQGIMKEIIKNTINEDLKPCLSKINVKTLIIWGDKDKLTPVSDAYLMKREIKNSILEVLPDVGHRIRLEAPEILAEKVLNFIKL